MNKSELKPAVVFEQFAKINQIPRPSKREEKMIEYLKSWGESHGLDTKVDETGNVIIRKSATKGMENRKTVILQSHMDMVCDKLVDYEIDFDKDPIKTYVDGEWLTAEGTTLGADDGIGCAMELALLAADDIEHGPIECVFTRDEETGLTGAEGMKAGFMTGDFLINLDSEDEGEIFVSCAGGRNTSARAWWADTLATISTSSAPMLSSCWVDSYIRQSINTRAFVWLSSILASCTTLFLVMVCSLLPFPTT